jgi:hypothetical protein
MSNRVKIEYAVTLSGARVEDFIVNIRTLCHQIWWFSATTFKITNVPVSIASEYKLVYIKNLFAMFYIHKNKILLLSDFCITQSTKRIITESTESSR